MQIYWHSKLQVFMDSQASIQTLDSSLTETKIKQLCGCKSTAR